METAYRYDSLIRTPDVRNGRRCGQCKKQKEMARFVGRHGRKVKTCDVCRHKRSIEKSIVGSGETVVLSRNKLGLL